MREKKNLFFELIMCNVDLERELYRYFWQISWWMLLMIQSFCVTLLINIILQARSWIYSVTLERKTKHKAYNFDNFFTHLDESSRMMKNMEGLMSCLILKFVVLKYKCLMILIYSLYINLSIRINSSCSSQVIHESCH